MTLIVDGCHATGGVTPAATGIPSPTVATAPTRTPSASSPHDAGLVGPGRRHEPDERLGDAEPPREGTEVPAGSAES